MVDIITVLNVFILCFLVLVPWSAHGLLPRPSVISVGFFAAAVLLASLLDAVTGALVLIAGISWLVHTYERPHEKDRAAPALLALAPSVTKPTQSTSEVEDVVVKNPTRSEAFQPVDSERYSQLASTMHISTLANNSFSDKVAAIVPHGELPPWFPFE